MQLPLLDHVHGLYCRNQFLGAPERFESQHCSRDLFHRPVVLLDDVVEAFRLPQSDIKAAVLIDAMDSSGVGTTFFDDVLLGQAMQIDGALQRAPCRPLVSLGSE